MDSFEEIKKYYSRKNTQNEEEYIESHKPRLDYLIRDLRLENFREKVICEFGAGSGYVLGHLHKSNKIIAVDGYHIDESDHVLRSTMNLDQPYSDIFLERYGQIDIAFSFEMLEHLTNPYNFILELKKVLKEDGLLYLSVPHEMTQHNTYYPALFYPVDNLIEFFSQMAFKVEGKTIHSKRFVQNVLILRNRPWDEVAMRWKKDGDEFKGQPPHVQINL